MLICSRNLRILPLIGLQMALVALVAATMPAHAQWERVRVADPGFSVEVPEGWRVREVEGRGARLVPPDNGAPVEVVAWHALWPPATPEKAAIEHEGVLSRAIDYRRDSVEQIETDEGAPALVVSGRVRARGITEASIFCAYAAGSSHYVIGTFAADGTLPELRAAVLDRMMRSFRAEIGAVPITQPPVPQPEPPVVEPEPEPEPAPQPEPDPEPQPEPGPPELSEPEPGSAPGNLQVSGQPEPVLPDLPEPETPWVQHLNPAGFSVWIPVDWQVSVQEGLIVLRPAVPAAGRGLAFAWPVVGADPGAEAALRLALSRLPDLRLLRATQERPGAPLIQGVANGGMRIAATWSHSDGFGLLQAVVAPEASWERDLPSLARMIAGLRPGQWPVAHQPEVEVLGDRGLLRWAVPAGWQVRGGAVDDAGDISIDIEALGPTDEALRVGWQQPVQPRFRALTPLLESLGWREGERYSVPEGGGGLLIYRRRDPEQLVRDLLLPRHPRELRLTSIQAGPPDAAIAALLAQPDAVGRAVTLKGDSAIGARERLYLAASARSEGALATTCWDGASLRADAPEGRLPAAVEVLAMMVRGARVTERASESQAQRLHDLIERAQRAMATVSAELLPEDQAGLSSVVGAELRTPAAGFWLAPAGEGDSWWLEQAGGSGAPTSAMPRPGG